MRTVCASCELVASGPKDKTGLSRHVFASVRPGGELRSTFQGWHGLYAPQQLFDGLHLHGLQGSRMRVANCSIGNTAHDSYRLCHARSYTAVSDSTQVCATGDDSTVIERKGVHRSSYNTAFGVLHLQDENHKSSSLPYRGGGDVSVQPQAPQFSLLMIVCIAIARGPPGLELSGEASPRARLTGVLHDWWVA